MNEDKKFDKGKIMWSHLPWDVIEEAAQIISDNAIKHNETIGKPAWKERPQALERYFSALLRHLMKVKKGIITDDESKKRHAAHVLANAIILSDIAPKEKEQVTQTITSEAVAHFKTIPLKKGEYYYLAHPWRIEKEIRQWQLDIQQQLGINLFNPLYDHDEEGIRELDLMVVQRKDMTKELSKRLTTRDKRLIEHKNCKGIIAFFIPGMDSFGTSMELFYNSDILRKEAYTIVGSDYIKNHPWIVENSTRVFETKEAFETFAQKFLSTKDANEEVATQKNSFRFQ